MSQVVVIGTCALITVLTPAAASKARNSSGNNSARDLFVGLSADTLSHDNNNAITPRYTVARQFTIKRSLRIRFQFTVTVLFSCIFILFYYYSVFFFCFYARYQSRSRYCLCLPYDCYTRVRAENARAEKVFCPTRFVSNS